jgi:hypothetical protein
MGMIAHEVEALQQLLHAVGAEHATGSVWVGKSYRRSVLRWYRVFVTLSGCGFASKGAFASNVEKG